ncbi:MAG: hypothetical protein N2657_05050, partial [bacterium]|nr:hypothetical protein [bacterium]
MNKFKRIAILSLAIIMVSLSLILSGCFNSSRGGLNPVLLGGGSGGSEPSFSAAIPFDDISDNPGVVFVDPSDDFYGNDDGLATLSDAIPFNFTLFGSS